MREIKDMACLEKSSFQQINICHHQDMLGTKFFVPSMACLEKSSFQQINICHHQDMLGTKFFVPSMS